jgi:hypothetical protein
MMGLGQKARIRAGRFCNRPGYIPEKPGEAWGPPCSDKRRLETESPRVVLHEEEGSTTYGAVVGFPKKRRLLGKPADRLTWGRCYVGDRDQ